MRFSADVFDKTSTSMFLSMFEKIQKIVLTMHISDVFWMIGEIPENFTNFSNVEKKDNFYKQK